VKIRAFVTDFDGTLVSRDVLDVVCGIVGKCEESRQLGEDFISGTSDGLSTLKKRIDLLRGVTLEQIRRKLAENDFLYSGTCELFSFLRKQGILTVLLSGNLLPVLEHYKERLGISEVIGITPRMANGAIQGIELEDFPSRDFKADGCRAILSARGIGRDAVVAMGDSPSDATIFDLASLRIAVNPKGNLAERADYVVGSDLTAVIKILQGTLQK
jgi:phosphoserine phosphatase